MFPVLWALNVSLRVIANVSSLFFNSRPHHVTLAGLELILEIHLPLPPGIKGVTTSLTHCQFTRLEPGGRK